MIIVKLNNQLKVQKYKINGIKFIVNDKVLIRLEHHEVQLLKTILKLLLSNKE